MSSGQHWSKMSSGVSTDTVLPTPTKLTPSTQQQEILDWVISGSGNLMIQAYAGTGKTSTLLMTLPYMSGEVFMGAFNKSIQLEIEAKVGRLKLPDSEVTVKTLHAAGLGAYKYGGGSRTTKIESNKMRLLLGEAAEKDPLCQKYENFLYKLIGYAKRAGLGTPLMRDQVSSWEELIEYYCVDDELPQDDKFGNGAEYDKLMEQLIPTAQFLYQTSLSVCRDEIDFDDMLLAPIYFNSRFKKYDWVLIDELQDCSAIRREIAIRMLKPGGRMLAVGDEFQNIYSFTGCESNAMELLSSQMKMKVLPLSVTYRCPKNVVKVANQWVPGLEAAPTAPDGPLPRVVYLEPVSCAACMGTGKEGAKLFAPSAEDEHQALMCEECDGTGKSGPGFWDEAHLLTASDVILCRNNRPIIELAYALLKKNIPCQIEGRDFAGSLVKLCQRWKVRELNALENKLSDYRLKEAAKWRLKKNEERAVGVEDKVETLLTLLDAVRSTGKSKVSDLIDKINIMFGDTEPGTKPRVLTLSTVHKWKGRENKRVFILGRDKYMPSKWAKTGWQIQNEKNLLYVAFTRSMEELIDIIVPEVETRRK